MKTREILFMLLCCFSLPALATNPIHLGLLATGSVSWEIVAIQRAGLDKQPPLEIQTQTLANAEAGKIALQAGSVDIIVTDWLWVSQQRSQGADFTFIPYSNQHGALIVPPKSTIQSLKDLEGKKLGIAGGGLDKNWLLLQALARKQGLGDLSKKVEVVFAAPPLLNQQLQQGNLDATLNYWNHAVKLEAQGYRRLLDGHSMLSELGIEPSTPMLGYVFRATWAKANKTELQRFLDISRTARQNICAQDDTWQAVAPLTQESDAIVLAGLRQNYCAGTIQSFGEKERAAMEKLYQLLQQTGGITLTGSSPQIANGTFWSDNH